jgi:hypothetical protein
LKGSGLSEKDTSLPFGVTIGTVAGPAISSYHVEGNIIILL